MRRWSRPERRLLALAAALTLTVALLRTVPGMGFSANLGLLGLGGVLAMLGLSRLSRYLPPLVYVLRALWCLAAAGAAGMGALYLLVLAYGSQGSAGQRAEAVIVLGAGVNGTTPSVPLQTRIDAAAAYLRLHPDTPAVLTGGQGSGEDISEARAIFRALTQQGIPPDRLLLEEGSTNTRENVQNALAVLSAAGLQPKSIAVVTNDFHMARAHLLLSRLTAAQAVAVPARLPWWWLTANYRLRECFALVKDYFWTPETARESARADPGGAGASGGVPLQAPGA